MATTGKRLTVKKRRNDSAFVILDLVVVLGIICALAGVLSPVVDRARHSSLNAACQSNLRVIGQAVALYVDDYSQRFPSNRITRTAFSLTQRAYLSKTDGVTANPSVNFVEALASYLPRAGGDATATWKCPAVGSLYWTNPSGQGAILGYGIARNTYALNFGLLEVSKYAVTFPTSTLMFREIGTNEHAWCCAAYDSTGPTPPTTVPRDIFLFSDTAHTFTNISKTLHGNTSNVLCVDGHVVSMWNAITIDANVRNDSPSAPGKWVLCDNNVATSPRLWISP